MSVIDLQCFESMCVSKNSQNIYTNRKILSLGQYYGDQYIIYLYFHLLPQYYIEHLEQAKLILYKIPSVYGRGTTNIPRQQTEQYKILPLLDYFSCYSNMYTPPQLDVSRECVFQSDESRAYEEIDITDLVNDWSNQDLENKGMMIQGNNDSAFLQYASDKYDVLGMRPVIRMTYQSSVCPPMSMNQCSVQVNKNEE
ncbi:DNRLRE domain-containing protein [Anaerotignum sp. MB30-C6]|uniref:DNRLRE domain-containing protein n=1 Tax=Anaerotignum sp. MB30-C6 TaxID=3070814 RepID=UPI0027DB8179|nr:DNRLRE domain-containing protein [Anaerotignum sp. MB30-C6]WMI81965.1 DNRLRE domain-containing protein [Anaerotignum sp. MB30-C6]